MAGTTWVQGRLEGVGPAIQSLKNLDRRTRRNILQRAVNRALNPLLKIAKAATPVGETGLARKSLGNKSKVYAAKGVVVGVMGPRRGYKKTRDGSRVLTALGRRYMAAGVDPVKYFHFLETGRKESRIPDEGLQTLKALWRMLPRGRPFALARIRRYAQMFPRSSGRPPLALSDGKTIYGVRARAVTNPPKPITMAWKNGKALAEAAFIQAIKDGLLREK